MMKKARSSAQARGPGFMSLSGPYQKNFKEYMTLFWRSLGVRLDLPLAMVESSAVPGACRGTFPSVLVDARREGLAKG